MSSLVSHLDPECMKAVELARLALPEGQRLSVPLLVDALYHATPLHDDPDMAGLARLFPAPARLHNTPPPAPVDLDLKRVLLNLRDGEPVTPNRLFAALLVSIPGRRLLDERGASAAELEHLVGPEPAGPVEEPSLAPFAAPPVPLSPKLELRQQRLAELAEYGRILTRPPGPVLSGTKVVSDALMHSLLQYLYTPRSRNILLVAPPGTGKTSLLHTLAHRIIARDAILPAALANLDLFELSPLFPRLGDVSGFTNFGPHEDFKHARRLLSLLQSSPGVVLCIDRLISFLHLLYRLSAHQELVDEFRTALDAGTITCIAGMHPEDIDRVAELDRSLLRRFRNLHLPPPAPDDVVRILVGRLDRLEKHFEPLKIPADLLPRLVSLTDQHLRDRNQPEKSIRLLEAACARAALEVPRSADATPPAVLTETHLLQALEGFIGPVVLPGKGLKVDDLLNRLGEQIVGQDDALRELSEAVVAGRADNGWFMRPGPRGVFLFGGPTGVGKTETALVLSRILGAGTDAVVRVDCQNLQGSGEGWEANTLTWRLLGVAPGYRGHVPGCRDGLLVKVRDYPECVLLFDEFEKADATVGRLILRILDEGKCQDSEGTEIDFRRSVVILTSNVGVSYTDPERGSIVLGRQSTALPPATVTEQTVSQGLLASGLGQEFLGRIQHVVLFRALTDDHIREIIGRQLDRLRDMATARGKQLSWTEAAISRLAGRWKSQPHLGARYLGTLVRVQILDPLNVAAASGELGDEVREILLDGDPQADGRVPRSDRCREGDRLRIVLR